MKKKLILLALLIVGGLAIYLSSKNSDSTLEGFETEFAVKNTENISRIFIASTSGLTADLKKKDGTWYINDKDEARQDAINTIMSALENLNIHSPVPTKNVGNFLKSLAANHKKVELYKNDESEPFKTIFIGQSNHSLNSNLCLVETKKDGRASLPFYVGKKGHKGIINPIFFMAERDWISTRIFEYPNLNFQWVEIEYPKNQEASFRIKKQGQDLLLSDAKKEQTYPQENTNRLALSEYLENYKMIHFEATNDNFPVFRKDSVLNTTPYAVIRLKNNSGKIDSLQVFEMEDERWVQEEGPVQHLQDQNYYHGYVYGKFVKLQRFVFDPVLYTKQDFLLQ